MMLALSHDYWVALVQCALIGGTCFFLFLLFKYWSDQRVDKHEERMAMIERGMHPDAPEIDGEQVADDALSRETADYERS